MASNISPDKFQDYKKVLLQYFSNFMPISDEEARIMTEDICIKSFKKGAMILEEGQVSTECYFIVQGCIRQYYLVEGEEKTSNFFTENQWVLSLKSFIQKIPADHYFACLEDCIVVVGNEEKENKIYEQSPKFESLSRMVLEQVVSEQQEALGIYATETPEQRYIRLLEKNPGLIQRVPQYMLASYIGIKPESLSRIRKRILSK